jgi:1-acyl-sn-glycerol-3-phosphate acyltransferase
MTEAIIDLFSERDHFCLGITPEGTRKPNARWKRGFYHIARSAKVPIVLVKLDYGNKCVTLFRVFHPSGDEEADIRAVKEAYRGVRAKHPKQFLID